MPIPRYVWIGAGVAVAGAGAWTAYRNRSFLLSRVSGFRDLASWADARGQEIAAFFAVKPDDLRPNGQIGPEGISADAWNRTKLAALHPRFRRRFQRFLAAAQAVAARNGREILIWEGTRALSRQLDLYRQGREHGGEIVTWTITSWHLFGMAVDLMIRAPGAGPSWGHRPAWYVQEVLPLAANFGLESLYLTKGKDPPHVQAPEGAFPANVAQAKVAVAAEFQTQRSAVGLA